MTVESAPPLRVERAPSAPPMRVAPDEIELQVLRVEQRLTEDFADSVPEGLVSQHVREARATFDQARITQFVPTLIERIARQRLLEMTRRV